MDDDKCDAHGDFDHADGDEDDDDGDDDICIDVLYTHIYI